MIDRTLINGGFWDRATFTVPEDVPEERVQFHASKYMGRFGSVLEGQGFTVREMLRPQVSNRLPQGGRRRYDILAFVSRKPIVIKERIPDMLVPKMQRLGMKLVE